MRLELNSVREFQLAEKASTSEGRKVFKEMMAFAALKKNNITHIVVEKADRYTRNFKDAVLLDEWLAANPDRRLHSVKESLVLHMNAKSDVKFMWNIHVAAAKKYTDNLREETMKGWREKLEQGWMPSDPPLGYMNIKVNGRHVQHAPNPDTKSLVIKAFHTYLNPGESVASITKLMEQMGVRTRGGRPYAKSKIHKMLDNPYYIGIIRFDGKEYPGAQEPLISTEVFERVQVKLHGKRPTRYRRLNPVFKGVIHCSNCGGLVTWQMQKGNYYGACQRNSEACKRRKFLREDKVEQSIIQMLENLVCPASEIIQWVADSMRERQGGDIEEKERLWDSVKLQADRINRMEERLYDDKLAGDISQERYEAKHAEFVKQKAELQEKLGSIDRSFGNRLDHTLVLLELSQKASQIYTQRTPQQKRLIITKLFKNLTFAGDFLSVEYTDFTRVIAQNVASTKKLIGG